jgi:hypothetical protein
VAARPLRARIGQQLPVASFHPAARPGDVGRPRQVWRDARAKGAFLTRLKKKIGRKATGPPPRILRPTS